jgi:hypothetical protein
MDTQWRKMLIICLFRRVLPKGNRQHMLAICGVTAAGPVLEPVAPALLVLCQPLPAATKASKKQRYRHHVARSCAMR